MPALGVIRAVWILLNVCSLNCLAEYLAQLFAMLLHSLSGKGSSAYSAKFNRRTWSSHRPAWPSELMMLAQLGLMRQFDAVFE